MQLDREGLLRFICKLGDCRAHGTPSYFLGLWEGHPPCRTQRSLRPRGLSPEGEGARRRRVWSRSYRRAGAGGPLTQRVGSGEWRRWCRRASRAGAERQSRADQARAGGSWRVRRGIGGEWPGREVRNGMRGCAGAGCVV